MVGCDIGYGDGISVGGSKYVLVLVNQCSTNSFVYGMHGLSGADVCETLWKFFIKAGGFPKTLQCDFDTRLVGGKAAALLRSHGTRTWAAPPHRQDKNGLVKRKWQSLTKMARSFLTAVKLPKKFWFLAIQEASIRINMLPVVQQQDRTPEQSANLSIMTTPYFEFLVSIPIIAFYIHLDQSILSSVPVMVIINGLTLNCNVCWELHLVIANILMV